MNPIEAKMEGNYRKALIKAPCEESVARACLIIDERYPTLVQATNGGMDICRTCTIFQSPGNLIDCKDSVST